MKIVALAAQDTARQYCQTDLDQQKAETSKYLEAGDHHVNARRFRASEKGLDIG